MGSGFRVGIVGGGIAGVTALMALADLGERRLQVDLISPKDAFVLRPQLIGGPWGGPPLHLPFAELVEEHAGRHLAGTVNHVDPLTRRVALTDGTGHDYDAVLVATGARNGIAYPGVWTIGFGPLPKALAHAAGRTVAVVVPAASSWTLPAYQLALLIAQHGPQDVRVITPEVAPLALFGPGAAEAITGLLTRSGIRLELGRTIGTGPYEAQELAEHVIALPSLDGPQIGGLPLSGHGFITVDEHQHVCGSKGVYAAGDAADHAIKQGGLAAEQAERAAEEILRVAGVEVPRRHGAPTLRGKLVAADEELYLHRVLDGQDRGQAAPRPLWQPPAAMLAWRLSRWLENQPPPNAGDALGPLAHPDPEPAP